MVPPELISLLSGNELLDIAQLPGLPVTKKLEESTTFTAGRVGFRREDEFFEDGDVHRHLYLQDILTGVGEVEERPRVSEFPCQVADCAQLFDTLELYEHHYNTLHRNVCSTCKRSFPSLRLLDIHILEWHDSLFQVMAEKANMFQCLVEGCMEKFKTSGERKNHLIKSHLYPSDFRFDKPKKNKRSVVCIHGTGSMYKETSSKIKQECYKGKPQSMDITPADSSVVESMEISVSSTGDHSSPQATTSSLPPNKPRCKIRWHNAIRRYNLISQQVAASSTIGRLGDMLLLSIDKYKIVPSTICFGHGSVRGFRHARKKK